MEAHPRSRGENRGHRRGGAVSTGSSPLTRGKLEHELSDAVAVGLIPAHAGKNAKSVDLRSGSRGSSPLTRGKLRAILEQGLLERLIPAHAGKTDAGISTTPSRGAHPRSRGENSQAEEMMRPRTGSSPLTRGKRRLFPASCGAARLIPAHAGKTSAQPSTRRPQAAHPRSRGENDVGQHFSVPFRGSSPLTRGKRPRGRHMRCRDRLIPAHAGKTASMSASAFAITAHPRSRGENSSQLILVMSPRGSSPLTRGKPSACGPTHVKLRLIPAHAGKTKMGRTTLLAVWAHPRSRGENTGDEYAMSAAAGSSPLTRGKLAADCAARRQIRLIPAHAGKTN